MARSYSASFENVAITAAQDLFNIAPAADKPIKLQALVISNVGGAADAGDAQEELLRISIRRFLATVTNGTGGSTPTPVALDPSDAASGATVRANDATTRASTSGTNSLFHADGFNVRIPYQMIWTPETQLEIAGTVQRIIIGLDTAPADSLSVSGTVYFEEE